MCFYHSVQRWCSGLNKFKWRANLRWPKNVNTVENWKHKDRDTSLDITDTEWFWYCENVHWNFSNVWKTLINMNALSAYHPLTDPKILVQTGMYNTKESILGNVLQQRTDVWKWRKTVCESPGAVWLLCILW